MTTATAAGPLVSQAELWDMQCNFTTELVRLEQRTIYRSDLDVEAMIPWLSGEPVGAQFAASPWVGMVRDHVAAGRTIGRVRIFADSPTPYQQWERACSEPMVVAGEDQRYISRSQADAIGVTEDAGDWWIFDRATMVEYHFDSDHRWLAELVSDSERIEQALAAWAIIHSAALPHQY